MSWLNWVEAITSFYLIIGALIISTTNIQSAITFRVIPFFLGLAIAVATIGKLLGWPIGV